MSPQDAPLAGLRVTCVAVNVPAPLAAAQFLRLGATVAKLEPPGGDPLEHACGPWYAAIVRGMEVGRVDLKASDGRRRLGERLADTDLLITSSRASSLHRLGLAWPALHARHPRLCQVAIIGYPPPRDDTPGHDLTYQADAGLVAPPDLPRTLVADLAGAQQALAAGLALLLARERGAGGGFARVSLSDAARAFAEPLAVGLTAPGGSLGGGLAAYGVYRAADGWVALAALELRFRDRLALELQCDSGDRAALARIFATKRAADWEAWAAERDLPIVALSAGRRVVPGEDEVAFLRNDD
jgi:alpha-methylacyl-CoA racemase